MTRITYWTGNWNPGREAISNEIEALRTRFGVRNPVVSFSAKQQSRVYPATRVIALNGTHWPSYWLLGALIERMGDVTHAFGAVDSWHQLRALGRRPFVFTAVIGGRMLDPTMYRRVSVFVAESEPIAKEIALAGVDPRRIRTIYPGVDLSHFVQSPLPTARPFRLLFASTPADPAEFEARGILLLVELARRCPEIEIVFAWRQWGRVDAAKAALTALAPPRNCCVEWQDFPDMRRVFQGVHATVMPFADGFGKSCPNSVIEAMACGRPVLITEGCGIAGLVRDAGAGVVVERNVQALGSGVRDLMADFTRRAAAARALAESHFDLTGFLDAYQTVYRDATSLAG